MTLTYLVSRSAPGTPEIQLRTPTPLQGYTVHLGGCAGNTIMNQVSAHFSTKIDLPCQDFAVSQTWDKRLGDPPP